MFSLNEILPNERKEEGKSLTDKYKLYSTEYLEHLKDSINKNCNKAAKLPLYVALLSFIVMGVSIFCYLAMFYSKYSTYIKSGEELPKTPENYIYILTYLGELTTIAKISIVLMIIALICMIYVGYISAKRNKATNFIKYIIDAKIEENK